MIHECSRLVSRDTSGRATSGPVWKTKGVPSESLVGVPLENRGKSVYCTPHGLVERLHSGLDP
jgi:hypothetical protein